MGKSQGLSLRLDARTLRLGRWIGLCVAFAVLALATPAGAVPGSAPLGDVLAEANELKTTLEGEGAKKSLLKKISKSITKLEAAETLSYAKGVKALRFTAKTWEKKFSDRAALGTALTTAAETVTEELEIGLNTAGLMLPSTNPIGVAPTSPFGKRDDKMNKRDPFRKQRKFFTKANKFLAKAAALANNPTVKKALSKQYLQLEKAAKFLKDKLDLQLGMTKNWVVSSLTIAPAGTGFNMDGEDGVDNAVAEVVGLIEGLPTVEDGSIGQLLIDKLKQDRAAAITPIIQMWGFEDYTTDPFVFAGLLNGVDLDDDTSNNYSGSETFDVSATSAQDGHPFVRTLTSFDADGNYVFIVDGERQGAFDPPGDFDFEIAQLELPGDIPFGVMGQASETANDGMLGIAIPMDRLLGFLDKELPIELPAFLRSQIAALADLDVDGDGTDESISAAFDFTSVPAEISLAGIEEGITQNWVVCTLDYAGPGVGHDFNGDSVPDNAFGGLRQALTDQFPAVAGQIDWDNLLSGRLAAQAGDGKVNMLQMWAIQQWEHDHRVFLGVFNAQDTDADPANNCSGTATFNPGVTLNEDGHPQAHGPSTLGLQGAYGFSFDGAVLELAGLPVYPDAFIYLDGTATAAANDGSFAFLVSAENIIALLESVVPNPPLLGPVQNFIRGLADVASTEGGENDLISVALEFTSVSATLE